MRPPLGRHAVGGGGGAASCGPLGAHHGEASRALRVALAALRTLARCWMRAQCNASHPRGARLRPPRRRRHRPPPPAAGGWSRQMERARARARGHMRRGQIAEHEGDRAKRRRCPMPLGEASADNVCMPHAPSFVLIARNLISRLAPICWKSSNWRRAEHNHNVRVHNMSVMRL